MYVSLTEISLGEIRDLGPYDVGSDMFGLFVLEPSVQESGTLVSIESRGLFTKQMGQQHCRLRILVYRET